MCIALANSSFSQTPTPTPESQRIRILGSSLERVEKDNRNPPPKADAPIDSDIIRVKTNLFVSDALVADQNGKVVSNLKKEDFVITEDGVPQSIEIFSPGGSSPVPRSIVLIIDCSLLQVPYLRESIEASKILVDHLGPNDDMAIVTATDLKVRMDFTQDKVALRAVLNTLQPDLSQGSVIAFETLMAVLNEMLRENNRQSVVIFHGDGSHVIWLKPDKDSPYPVSRQTRSTLTTGDDGSKSMRKSGFADVKTAIENSRATIYSVIPGIRFLGLAEKERMARGKTSWENLSKAMGWKDNLTPPLKRWFVEREVNMRTAGQAAMYRVAELSGGNTAIIEKVEDADRVYSAIFETINSRYVIGYYPPESKQTHQRRDVNVTVRHHPEYSITARKTYIAN